MADGADPGEVDIASLIALRQLQRPGEPDAVVRILARFFTESAQRVAALQASAAAGDAQAIERDAHALKGIAGTIGAHAVCDLALRLEQIGREGRSQDAAPLVTELEPALGRARAAYERALETSISDRN